MTALITDTLKDMVRLLTVNGAMYEKNLIAALPPGHVDTHPALLLGVRRGAFRRRDDRYELCQQQEEGDTPK